MSKYTPESVDEVCEAWVVHAGHELLTAVDLVEGREGFLSWLADRDAQVRADSYEEARQGIAGAIKDKRGPEWVELFPGFCASRRPTADDYATVALDWKPGDRP